MGNAPNAAVAAARLGLRSALVAHIGDDKDGKDTVAALTKEWVDTKFIIPEQGKHTNYSYLLWYGQERTILRRNEEFHYTLPDIDTPKLVYLSSTGSDTGDFYNELASYLDTHPEVKFALQPGSKEITLGTKLGELYKRAYIYFSNVEEAGKILGVETLGIKELLKRMHDLGPKIVVITDGPKGAYAYDGTDIWSVPVFPDGLKAYERTGAGDSFSSTTAAALILGHDLPTALMWGAANSASVVQKVGGQEGLMNRADLEQKITSVSSDFKPTKLEA